MRPKNSPRGRMAAALMVGVLLAAPTQAATKLRFAHAGPESDTQHAAAREFARLVEERTHGEIRVQIFPNNMLGNDQAMIAGVRGGTIDMEMSGNPNFTGLAPKLNAFDLPYVFRDAAHAHRVLDGEPGQRALAELGEHELKGLAFWEVGFRSITNSKHPVQGPEDVRGLKIRTSSNAAHVHMFELLGANPVPMPIAELYNALEMKAVDAQEHPVGITWAAHYDEVQKYLSLTRHAYTAMIVVMNKAKFDALPAGHQQVLVEAAREAGQFQRDLNAAKEAEMIAELRERGMEVIEGIDSEPFRRVAAGPVRQVYVEKHGSELVEAIDAAQ